MSEEEIQAKINYIQIQLNNETNLKKKNSLQVRLQKLLLKKEIAFIQKKIDLLGV